MSKYADQLECASIELENGDAAKAERLRINETGEIEIRFSWWTQNGNQFQHAPLDIPEKEWLKLFEAALKNNVFSKEFVNDLIRILKS